jgi:hypothetical protein
VPRADIDRAGINTTCITSRFIDDTVKEIQGSIVNQTTNESSDNAARTNENMTNANEEKKPNRERRHAAYLAEEDSEL